MMMDYSSEQGLKHLLRYPALAVIDRCLINSKNRRKFRSYCKKQGDNVFQLWKTKVREYCTYCGNEEERRDFELDWFGDTWKVFIRLEVLIHARCTKFPKRFGEFPEDLEIELAELLSRDQSPDYLIGLITRDVNPEEGKHDEYIRLIRGVFSRRSHELQEAQG